MKTACPKNANIACPTRVKIVPRFTAWRMGRARGEGREKGRRRVKNGKWDGLHHRTTPTYTT